MKRSRKSKRGSFAKRVRAIVKKVAEPKSKTSSFAKGEIYHNCFYSGAGVNTGYLAFLSDSVMFPNQGVADSQRIGDQIYTSHINLKMLIGQKADRPNVNFRWFLFRVPKGATINYNNWFVPVTGNILLDDPNRDNVKVVKTGYWRPNMAGLLATGNDEFTFTKRIRVPYKRLIKFGPADAAITHNDTTDLYFSLMAWKS